MMERYRHKLLTLEERYMLDGAGAATSVEAFEVASVDFSAQADQGVSDININENPADLFNDTQSASIFVEPTPVTNNIVSPFFGLPSFNIANFLVETNGDFKVVSIQTSLPLSQLNISDVQSIENATVPVGIIGEMLQEFLESQQIASTDILGRITLPSDLDFFGEAFNPDEQTGKTTNFDNDKFTNFTMKFEDQNGYKSYRPNYTLRYNAFEGFDSKYKIKKSPYSSVSSSMVMYDITNPFEQSLEGSTEKSNFYRDMSKKTLTEIDGIKDLFKYQDDEISSEKFLTNEEIQEIKNEKSSDAETKKFSDSSAIEEFFSDTQKNTKHELPGAAGFIKQVETYSKAFDQRFRTDSVILNATSQNQDE